MQFRHPNQAVGAYQSPEWLKQPLRGLIGLDGGFQAIGRQGFGYSQMWRGHGRVERFYVTMTDVKELLRIDHLGNLE